MYKVVFPYFCELQFVCSKLNSLFFHSLNAVVVFVNNRLALDHRYPSQYDDGYHVLKFIHQNFTVLPHVADIMKCFLAADSVGGNLARHVAVRICTERLRMLNIK
ncbi:hypothetical protein JHK82_025288 [Glycine max]|nr:hypothetical protein JHK82_025288 [Glycine max]